MYESCLIFYPAFGSFFRVCPGPGEAERATAEKRERDRERERERAREREWRSGVDWRGREKAERGGATCKSSEKAKEQQKQKESKKEDKRELSAVQKRGRPHTLEAAHTRLTSSSTRPPPHRQRTLSTRCWLKKYRVWREFSGSLLAPPCGGGGGGGEPPSPGAPGLASTHLEDRRMRTRGPVGARTQGGGGGEGGAGDRGAGAPRQPPPPPPR